MSKTEDKTTAPAAPARELTTKETISEAIQMGILAARQMDQAQQPQRVVPPIINRERCNDCGQMKGACKEKHKKLVVLPSDPEDATYFPGIWLNGVRYLSNNHAHVISVPEDSAIEKILQDFEQGERRARRGRKFEHNSGSIGGPNAQGASPFPVTHIL